MLASGLCDIFLIPAELVSWRQVARRERLARVALVGVRASWHASPPETPTWPGLNKLRGLTNLSLAELSIALDPSPASLHILFSIIIWRLLGRDELSFSSLFFVADSGDF